jgi:hypothetical protein
VIRPLDNTSAHGFIPGLPQKIAPGQDNAECEDARLNTRFLRADGAALKSKRHWAGVLAGFLQLTRLTLDASILAVGSHSAT